MTDIIRDLPVDERPRERMLRHGASTLSNAELLAVLLGSGVRGKNAIQLGRELLKDGFSALRKRDLRELDKIPGIGLAKLTRIFAAIELSERMFSEIPDEPPPYDLDILGRALVTQYARERQERLGAVLLDSRARVLKQQEIYVGTIDNALVSTRDIITFTLLEYATGVVLYHNHPSGSPIPSEDDMTFTNKLNECLAKCDIDLVDHLIIGAHGFYSMKERGQL